MMSQPSIASIASSPLSSPSPTPQKEPDEKKMPAPKVSEKPGNAGIAERAVKTSFGASVDASFQSPSPRFDHREVLEDPYHSEMNRDTSFKEGASPHCAHA